MADDASNSTVTPGAAGGRADALRFSWRELSGSLGDLGTFLPLVVAMSVACELDLGVILILAGLMNVLSGWWFRQPIPVQPMKAIAAVAITEQLVAGQIAAAGLITGVAIMVIGACGAADWAGRTIPKAVVRAIQLGVGVKLFLCGVEWLSGFGISGAELTRGDSLPWLAPDSLLVAAVAGALLLFPRLRRAPVLLVVFLAGFALLYVEKPGAYEGLGLAWPAFGLVWPTGWDQWLDGLWHGAAPQLPLTLLNSVIAVCALSADYFPGRGISPRRTAFSVGLMNLLCVPWGAIPMCHGAGGLAAQYRFGARTGGSVIMLGLIKVVAGLLFGATLLTLLTDYPLSILAVMIMFAGYTLASAARDCLKGRDLIVVLAGAIPIILINTTAGFLIAILAALLLRSLPRAHNPDTPQARC